MKAKKPDISLIRKYLNGDLDERAMYELERQAEENPQLMDVIKGMESADDEIHMRNLTAIDHLLAERIKKEKTRRIIPWTMYPVAASLIFGLTIGAWWFTHRPEKEIITQKSTPREQKDKIDPPVMAGKEPVVIGKLQKQSANKSMAPLPNKMEKALKESIPIASNTKYSEYKGPVNLNEVTIVGYGEQKKSTVVGSVSSVNTTDAVAGNLPDSNLINSLKAKASEKIMIRGMSANRANMEITGKVVDNDKKPLPGVSVQVAGTQISAQTNADGKFSISIPENIKALMIAMLGYETQQIEVRKGESMEIEMEPNTATLGEVVVVGYSSKNETPEKVHPVIGWRAYKEYLKENAVSPDDNTHRINIEFTVDHNGAKTNFIAKGSDEILNQKAIMLIKNGPIWTGRKDGKTETVKLRITFHK